MTDIDTIGTITSKQIADSQAECVRHATLSTEEITAKREAFKASPAYTDINSTENVMFRIGCSDHFKVPANQSNWIRPESMGDEEWNGATVVGFCGDSMYISTERYLPAKEIAQ